MTGQERSARRREMARWIGRRDRQGLTWRELSELSGIPVPTLQGWRLRLGRGAGPARSIRRRFAEIRLRAPGTSRGTDLDGEARYEIGTRSGHQLRLRDGFDPEAVACLLELLDRRC